jgi:two-component system, cell cycle response regulator DivK
MRDHERPLILVVDDYEDNRLLYAESLRQAGYQVATADDGVQAVAQARSLRPALVVMDLSMPGMDGCEATSFLRSLPETKKIWIIAVTAHSDRYDQSRARSAGVDAFALKPLLPDQLTELVVAGLRASRGR